MHWPQYPELWPLWALATFAVLPSLIPARKGLARFKALTDPRARASGYLRMLLFSMMMFGAFGLILTNELYHVTAVRWMPYNFLLLRDDFVAHLAPFLTGVAIGLALLIPIFLLLNQNRRKRGAKPAPRHVAEMTDRISPLMPRTFGERCWVALISINAGISEEIFFRLALPLLFLTVTDNGWLAMLLATAVFGLVHIYQGWLGVVMTFCIGGALALIYIATGHLWIAMLVHALFDLNALVLRPWLKTRATPAPA